mgnify:FL=1
MEDVTLEELVANMAADPDSYTADQIFNAATDYDVETICQAMKNDKVFAVNLSILEESYMEKKGIEVVIEADGAIAEEIDAGLMRVIGAAYNSKGGDVTVRLSTPEKEAAVDGDKCGGYPAAEWCDIAGQWYYFNGDGYMVTGWQQVNGIWYYLKPDGAMHTGWLFTGDKWYYLNADGSMAAGWIKLDGKWYYLNQNGDMETASKEIGGKVYSFDEKGACTNP